MGEEKRRVPRFDAVVVFYIYDQAGKKHNAYLNEVALLGIGFESNDVFSLGEQLTVSLNLAVKSPHGTLKNNSMTIPATVRFRSEERVTRCKFYYGVEFSEIDIESVATLDTIVAHAKENPPSDEWKDLPEDH